MSSVPNRILYVTHPLLQPLLSDLVEQLGTLEARLSTLHDSLPDIDHPLGHRVTAIAPVVLREALHSEGLNDWTEVYRLQSGELVFGIAELSARRILSTCCRRTA
jgi:hypothetical protein